MEIIKPILLVCLTLLTAIGWRMGGAENFAKQWRRIGSAFCIIFCLPLVIAVDWRICVSAVLIGIGCSTYCGFVNYIVRIFWKNIEMKREYWWNFATANMILQSGVLIFNHSIINIFIVLGSAVAIAFIKVGIDSDEDGQIIGMNEAVLSELVHGGLNCLAVIANLYV